LDKKNSFLLLKNWEIFLWKSNFFLLEIFAKYSISQNREKKPEKFEEENRNILRNI